MLPEILGPEVPVLFTGKQPKLEAQEDYRGGSFAVIKKYKLPSLRTVRFILLLQCSGVYVPVEISSPLLLKAGIH